MIKWKNLIDRELQKDYLHKINEFLKSERQKGKIIYPKQEDIFNAFRLTPFDQVRVIVLGQDPYHGFNEAHGLAFSCLSSKRPASLYNIYKEITDDLGVMIPKTNDLTYLAKQGVLLLNTSLTVEADKPGSHSKLGWQYLTGIALYELIVDPSPKVFMLWGNHAQEMFEIVTKTLDVSNHLILRAAHPSPLSADKGFFGCKHFSQANAFLLEKLSTFISWSDIDAPSCNLEAHKQEENAKKSEIKEENK